MRKFKHTQLGIIAVQNTNGTYTVNHEIPYKAHPLHIEGNSLLWQEITEPTNPEPKAWEIVAFKLLKVDTIHTIKIDGTWASNYGTDYYLKEVQRGNIDIHSIRIVSTNEVFTVGDKITCDAWKLTGQCFEIIKSFRLEDNDIVFKYESDFNLSGYLSAFLTSNLRHYTEPELKSWTYDDLNKLNLSIDENYYLIKKSDLK